MSAQRCGLKLCSTRRIATDEKATYAAVAYADRIQRSAQATAQAHTHRHYSHAATCSPSQRVIVFTL